MVSAKAWSCQVCLFARVGLHFHLHVCVFTCLEDVCARARVHFCVSMNVRVYLSIGVKS